MLRSLDPTLQARPQRHAEFKECLMLAIPAFFDLLATILMNIGLLWVTASVYQVYCLRAAILTPAHACMHARTYIF